MAFSPLHQHEGHILEEGDGSSKVQKRQPILSKRNAPDFYEQRPLATALMHSPHDVKGSASLHNLQRSSVSKMLSKQSSFESRTSGAEAGLPRLA